MGSESFAESLSFVPPNAPTHLGIAGYLQEIESARRRVDIPIIASLNGNAGGHWAGTVRAIEQAGAQAIELNLYAVPTDAERSGGELEKSSWRSCPRSARHPSAGGRKAQPQLHEPGSFRPSPPPGGARGLVLFNASSSLTSTSKPLSMSRMCCSALLPILRRRCVGSPC